MYASSVLSPNVQYLTITQLDLIEKLIVALTYCDSLNSNEELHIFWLNTKLDDWRIVDVCVNPGSNEGQLDVDHIKTLKNAVTKLKGISMQAKATKRFLSLLNKINDLICLIESTISKSNSFSNKDRQYHKEWFAKKWKQLEREFQQFYQSEIRPRVDEDSPVFLTKEDVEMKRAYNQTVDDVFRSVEATKKDVQRQIYLTCTDDDGIQNPAKGNIKIRNEIAKEFMHSIDMLTNKLDEFLWKKINKTIDWIQ